ncbi:MAG TPA: hypothetical protein VFS08_20715 [Gemmatimonadaceae bacterium]|nr:hypothetical protein [Gemmatimonadaceae bacterium]
MTHAMTCAECLSLVATADMTELTAATAVTEHCRGCADCASVVDEVAEETRRLADALDGTLPGVPSHVVALRAIAGAARGRRRTGRRRIALGAVALTAAPLLAAFVLRVLPVGATSVAVRTVELHCLAPEQALELAGPSLPPRVQVTTRPALHLPVLTLRGPRPDIAAAEQLLTQLDARWSAERSAHCASAPAPDAPATSAPATSAPATNAPASVPARVRALPREP